MMLTNIAARSAAQEGVYQAALERRAAGFSVIPLLLDGSKKPPFSWGEFQRRFPTDSELLDWFVRRNPFGLALVMGAISGHAETLDCEGGGLWRSFIDRVQKAVPAATTGPIIKTPRDGDSHHLIVRCSQPVPGNHGLAFRRDATKRDGWSVAFETRGQGGYAVGVGSPPAVHPLCRPYELESGDFRAIPVLSPEELMEIHAIAASFDERPPQPLEPNHRQNGAIAARNVSDGDRPGDEFNRRVTWPQILQPHGWRCVGTKGDVEFWRRPGKTDRGHSATTNFGGHDVLCVFSSNSLPFQAGQTYTKFGAFALLRHGGDFNAAGRALRQWGLGR
jgi:putative DNA primase/helicase